RSMRLAQLAPLADVADAAFISLQKQRLEMTTPAGLNLIDWTNELNDFADTAGLVANLDGVVAVDTSVAHLTGAMGKRVLTLITYVPDWRWGTGPGEATPWYPTMTLCRQAQHGRWDDAVERAVAWLRDL